MVPEVARLGACLVIDGIRNRAGDPAFEQWLAETTNKIASVPDGDDSVWQGFRRLHDAIGRFNQRFVAALDNLL